MQKSTLLTVVIVALISILALVAMSATAHAHSGLTYEPYEHKDSQDCQVANHASDSHLTHDKDCGCSHCQADKAGRLKPPPAPYSVVDHRPNRKPPSKYDARKKAYEQFAPVQDLETKLNPLSDKVAKEIQNKRELKQHE